MSTNSQLVSQLEAAKTQLNSALEAGQPTRAIRAEVARLEAALTDAQASEEAVQRDMADQDAAKVQASGAALAEAEHTAIEALGAPEQLAELLPEQFAPAERDPIIDTAAQVVAQAAAALEKAEAAHAELASTAAKLRTTLAAKQTALAEVKARRTAGTATPEDALEALGLPDDIADLERMLAIASEKAAAAIPHTERAELTTAQKHLGQAVETVKLRILRDRIALAESALLKVYRELRAAENASPLYRHRPSGDYRANPELKATVNRH